MKNNLRLLLLALTSALALGTGWHMYTLCQKEELWGHLPLLLFSAAWAAIVLFFWKKHTRHPKGLRWLGLSTLSGVLLSVGFPPIPATLLMFVGWVPLLMVEWEISQDSAKPNKKLLLRYSYHAFVVWNVLTTYWVGNTAFFAGIVAIWLNSFFMSVPFLAFHHTKKVLPRLGYTPFIAYWIAFEMLHIHWEISWSWLNLGNALACFPSWVQWYEYTGIFGGSLWILGVNVLIFHILKKSQAPYSFQKIWQEQRPTLLWITGLVIVPILLSLLMYVNYNDKGREVEVVVIQPNYEPHYQKFEVPAARQIEKIMQLAEKAMTDETEYLVLPESSFSAGLVNKMENNGIVKRLRKFLADHQKVKLVTGITAFKIFGPGEAHTRSTRMEVEGIDTTYWEAYNAAIQIEHGVDSLPFYIKSKLVPGAEILPYPNFFFFFKPLADKLGGSVEGHGTQPYREAFPSGSGKIAPNICYESIFGEYNAGYVQAGAEAIFIMTNDGWWANTAGHKQHLMFSTLRAIETRRSIARSTNTGVSAFINQRGDLSQPTKYEVDAAIREKIRFNDELTFYVKWGDIIGRFAVAVTGLLLLSLLVKRIRNFPAKEGSR